VTCPWAGIALLLLPVAAGAATGAGARPDAAGIVGGYGQMLVGLPLVILAIFACAWLLRRMGGLPVSNAGAIRFVAAINMGPRERVVLLEVGAERILVGIAPGQLRTLHIGRTPAPDAAMGAVGAVAARTAGEPRQVTGDQV
jgi:flagellar protein FliO/FliZ